LNIDVPAWARDAVWYQIFPERFRNGCPASNPCRDDFAIAPPPNWRVSPWRQDWYRQEDWEAANGNFYSSVYARRFGGDLIGVWNKLDYLSDLGINAIYLNPVFKAPSLHKYDGSSFHHIDPTFGPDRAGDEKMLARASETEDPSTWIWTAADRYFIELVREVHRRDMRIIIDGVFNHSGCEFFAFKDLLRRGKASRYNDWYRIAKWHKNGRFRWKGWFGHKSLPEFARQHGTLCPPVKKYIFDITRRWMDPAGDGSLSDGVDGWRLDVAYCLPHTFWKEWRSHVRAINSTAFLCAEIVSTASEYLQGDEFDAVMNYAWTRPVLSFFAPGREKPLPARLFRQRLQRLLKARPEPVNHVLQNLLDSHDACRVLTMLENPAVPRTTWNQYFGATRVAEHPDLATTYPGQLSRQVLRQLVIFQMTYIGAPMIYYGTEVGMWGANDPDCRQPMLWDDISFEPEERTVDTQTSATPRGPDNELLAFYRKAIALRHAWTALRTGGLRWLDTHSSRLLGFTRHWKETEIMVVLNAGDKALDYQVHSPRMDLWTGAPVRAAETVTVPNRGWRILLKRR